MTAFEIDFGELSELWIFIRNFARNFKIENVMTYIIIALGIIVAVALIIMMRNNVTQRKDLLRLRQEIEKEKERLAFLINNNFEVKDTNYYHLMTKMKDDQPNILGNVLHCTNGCDAGLCGTGDACKTCPVRLVIRNSFEQRRDFEKVEAKMSLYDENHNRQEVGVAQEDCMASQ